MSTRKIHHGYILLISWDTIVTWRAGLSLPIVRPESTEFVLVCVLVCELSSSRTVD